MSRRIDLRKVQSDFDYYARNLLVIKPKEGSLCRLEMNFPQQALYYGITGRVQLRPRWRDFVILDHGWKYYDDRNLPLRQYILKARQEGISTMGMARLFHRAHTKAGTNCMLVAQDDEATTTVFQMAKMFYSFLPDLLKPKTKNSNARELLFQEQDGAGGLNSWIRIQTAGWKNIGRSKTIHHLHCSEISFWTQPESVVDGLFQAVPRGSNTSIILETTAQSMGSWAYNVWSMAKKARADKKTIAFDPIFIPWFLHPDYRGEVPKDFDFTTDDKVFRDEYDLDWEQVYWYNYLKRSEFELAHPGQADIFLKTEYPSNDMECWFSGILSAFPQVAVEQIYKSQVGAPIARYTVVGGELIPDPNGRLRVWEKPSPNSQYAIGVDTSQGLGHDDSVICVVAHPGYRQVAEWADDHTGPKQLAPIIEAVAKWYNEAVVAVEVVDGSGMMCNATLNETYTNLYRWEYFDKQTKAETQKMGWQTNARTKTLLVDHVNSLLVPRLSLIVRSDNVATQMTQMVINPMGSGVNDYDFLGRHSGDHLMAWLIACMCCWRKIARFDQGADEPVPVDVAEGYTYDEATGTIHMYDQKLSDILTDHTDADEYARHWLNS